MYAAALGDSWSPPPHGALSQDGQSRWMVDPNSEGNKTGGWVPLWMWTKNYEMLARIKLGIPAFSAQDRPDIIGPVAAQIEADSIAMGHVPLIVSDIQFVQDAGAFTGQTVAGKIETPPPPAPPAPAPISTPGRAAPVPMYPAITDLTPQGGAMTVAPPLTATAVPDSLANYVALTFAAYGVPLAADSQGVQDWVRNLSTGGWTRDAFERAVAEWAPANGGRSIPAAVAVTDVAVPVVQTMAPAAVTAAPAAAPSNGLPWGKLALAGAAVWAFTRRGR